MLTIVLASSSPYRRELLSRFKLPFDVFSPDIDETPHMDEKAKDISFRLAREKAFKVAPHYANSLIIGSDQTAECQNQIIEKPNTHENAVKQLQFLRLKKISEEWENILLDAKKKQPSYHTFLTNIIEKELIFNKKNKNDIKIY